MATIIEAFYIFDEQDCILEHIYRARPPQARELFLRYSNHTAPRPAVLHLSDIVPPTTVYSVHHGKLLLQCTSSVESQTLAILEFIHRIIDIFEDFLGTPLLSNKIEENYEVVAQLLGEVCDGGVVCNTESNALRETVEVSSRLGRLFETVGIPGPSAATGPTNLAATLKANSSLAAGPAIPWRRPNVRHTSNELYVDIVESVSALFSPSGQPLSARANGSISFTSKLSGVPDLILMLNAPGGTSSAKSSGITRTMQLPVFHQCVRLARWKEHPGELSFIPPDGKFMLAGYEVDLLPESLNSEHPPSKESRLFLPATVDLRPGSGSNASDFEARLTLNSAFPGVTAPKPRLGPSARSSTNSTPFSFGAASNSGSSVAPTLEGVVVSIPFPNEVRNITDFKASRGDASFNFATKTAEWRVPTKDGFSVAGTATLTGTIVGQPSTTDIDTVPDEVEDLDPVEIGKSRTAAGYYDDESTADTTTTRLSNSTNQKHKTPDSSAKKLLPRSIAVSFVVRGWIPSGIKVESLVVDAKKSKGLGESVKPYKGVKYLTVSRKGVERRL